MDSKCVCMSIVYGKYANTGYKIYQIAKDGGQYVVME